MRKCSKYIVLSLMLLGLGLASASVVSATVPVTLVDGDWTNAIPSVTIVNSGSSGGLSTARWGTPTEDSLQSGYNFLSASTPFNAPTNGTAFALGTFTHLNYPIQGTALESIDLVVDLTIGSVSPTATFHFNHDETPNNYSPPSDPRNDDIVTLTNPILNVPFSYNGTNYFFNLVGFSQDGGVTTSTQFYTVEDQENVATLYGEITTTAVSIPEPATLLFLGLGLMGVAAMRRRFTK